MQISQIMETHFGRTGPLYLIREMRKLGFDSLSEMDDDARAKLVEALLDMCSSVMSRQKLMVVRDQLERSLGLAGSHASYGRQYQMTRNIY